MDTAPSRLRSLASRPPRDLASLALTSALLLAARAALAALPYHWVRATSDSLAERALTRATPTGATPTGGGLPGGDPDGEGVTTAGLAVAGVDVDACRRASWALAVGGRYLLGRRPCLAQALVGRWLYASAGLPTDVRIGAARGAGGAGAPGRDAGPGTATFMAHAWLEHRGQPVFGGRGAAGYSPFEAWPGQ